MLPIWLPVSTWNLPSRRRTAAPKRSESGSVASMRFAPVLLARSKASVKALGSSGLGAFTVGKLPSGSSCSFTTDIFLMPMRLSISRTGTLPEPWRGV